METLIGQRLRQAREAANHTPETASIKTGVAVRFIAALEKGDFREFGGRLYLERYGKIYAEFLGIYTEDFHNDLVGEWETYAFRNALRFQKPKLWRRLMLTFRPRHGVLALGSAVMLGILLYFGYQLSFLISAPRLTVDLAVMQVRRLEDPVVTVGGRVREEARLSLNHRPVTLTQDGAFQERLYLAPGLNKIDMEAVNVSGKKTSQILYAYFKD